MPVIRDGRYTSIMFHRLQTSKNTTRNNPMYVCCKTQHVPMPRVWGDYGARGMVKQAVRVTVQSRSEIGLQDSAPIAQARQEMNIGPSD